MTSVAAALRYQMRLRQSFRNRGAAGSACPRAQLAAALRLRPVRRAVLGHCVYRAAPRQPPQLAVPHPPGGGARGVRAARGRAGHQPLRRGDALAEPAALGSVPVPRQRDRLSSLGCAPSRATARRMRTAAAASTGTSPIAPCASASSMTPTGSCCIVPQLGGLRVATELGAIEVAPQEIVVIPRGLRFRVELLERARLAAISARTSARRCGCRTSDRSAPTAWPTRAISSDAGGLVRGP